MDKKEDMEFTHIVEIHLEDTETEIKIPELHVENQRELIEIMLTNAHDIIRALISYFNTGKNRFLIDKNWHDVRDYIKKILYKNRNGEKVLYISEYNIFVIPNYIKQHFLDCCIKEAFLVEKRYYESVKSDIKEKLHQWKGRRYAEQKSSLKKISKSMDKIKKKIEVLEKEEGKNEKKIIILKMKLMIFAEEKELIEEKILHIDELVYYASLILSRDISLFLKCLNHKTPSAEETFYNKKLEELCCSEAERVSMARRIRKFAKKIMKKPPNRKSYRSAYFESSLYNIDFQNENMKISLKPFLGKKNVINFTSKAFANNKLKLTKNITFISDDDKYYIHLPFKVKIYNGSRTDKEKGIDLGFTEVFSDQDGIKYEKDFGELMSIFSDWLNKKTAERNKIFAVYKKAIKEGDKEKADRILKNNLGTKKYINFCKKNKINLENRINYAINELLGVHEKPRRIIKEVTIEKLSSSFGFKLSKKMNRRLSFWLRGCIKKRIKFKTNKFGVKLTEVNPAYTSQMCPKCFYIDSKNRKGDHFECKKCSFTGDADIIAAKNILERKKYEEITIYTPPEAVKKFFHKKEEEFDSNTIEK